MFLRSFILLLLANQCAACPAGWEQNGSKCFKIINEEMTFFESLLMCREYYNGRLITTQSINEIDYLKIIKKRFIDSVESPVHAIWIDTRPVSNADESDLTIDTGNLRQPSSPVNCAIYDVNNHLTNKWRPSNCRYPANAICVLDSPSPLSTWMNSITDNAPQPAEVCDDSPLNVTKSFTNDTVLNRLFNEIENKQRTIIDLLNQTVAIPSISATPDRAADCERMVNFMKTELEKLGVETELVPVNETNGRQVAPILLGSKTSPNANKTILIYAHLDVVDAKISDGWKTDPFVLTEIDGKLYGRGATDDKGPTIAWLSVIDAYKSLNIDLPTNVKFLFESSEESGSFGMKELISDRKQSFFANIDSVAISDSYWLGNRKPCLTYGLRGMCAFEVKVTGPGRDLHSGLFGGNVREPLEDLVHLLASFKNDKGNIKVPGFYDNVAQLTIGERQLYTNIDFNSRCYAEKNGIKQFSFGDNKELYLMSEWRFPSLSIHGIQGAYCDKGSKSVIPGTVIGKFSVRLVPNMTVESVSNKFNQYLTNTFKTYMSPNKLEIKNDGIDPWVSDPSSPPFQAAGKATEAVWGVKPDLTRSGGTIPVTNLIDSLLGARIVLLPIGSSDDGAHSQNEKINIVNLINGAKVLAAYLYEIAKI